MHALVFQGRSLFYIARVNQYREANGVSFDDALRAVGGRIAENPQPNERLWPQVFGQRVEEVGVKAAAMSATNAVQMATSQPIEGEISREEAMRGVD